jgi:hypothetical protein
MGVTDSAISECGITCETGISYNALSAKPKSLIMDCAKTESTIMSYSADLESSIMESDIKESTIIIPDSYMGD